MARTRTLLNLRGDAYRRADLENATSLVPPADMTEYINQGIAHYENILAKARGRTWNSSTSTIVTSNGVSDYALHATFAFLLKVTANINGDVVPLTEFDLSEIAALSNTNVSWDGAPFRYMLMGGSIRLLPTPAGAYTVTAYYIPSATRLTADGDTFDGVDGWETFVIDWAARRAATKNRNYELVAILTADLAESKALIESMAPARDMSGPPRVQDVTLALSPLRGRRLWGRWR